jgi:hypothetical protein
MWMCCRGRAERKNEKRRGNRVSEYQDLSSMNYSQFLIPVLSDALTPDYCPPSPLLHHSPTTSLLTTAPLPPVSPPDY